MKRIHHASALPDSRQMEHERSKWLAFNEAAVVASSRIGALRVVARALSPPHHVLPIFNYFRSTNITTSYHINKKLYPLSKWACFRRWIFAFIFTRKPISLQSHPMQPPLGSNTTSTFQSRRRAAVIRCCGVLFLCQLLFIMPTFYLDIKFMCVISIELRTCIISLLCN